MHLNESADNLFYYPQPIAAPNFGDFLFLVTATEQRIGKFELGLGRLDALWIGQYVIRIGLFGPDTGINIHLPSCFLLRWAHRDLVGVVRSNGDMVDSYELHEIIDVANVVIHGWKGFRGHEGWVHDRADQPA